MQAMAMSPYACRGTLWNVSRKNSFGRFFLCRPHLAFPNSEHSRCGRNVRSVLILLQKSFCEAGLKLSGPYVQQLNNDVVDHLAKP